MGSGRSGTGTVKMLDKVFLGRRRRKGQSYVLVAIVLVATVGSQTWSYVEAATGGEDSTGSNNVTRAAESPPVPVSQVRYRSRPVALFRSNGSTNPSNSNESNAPENGGVPTFAVHDLTSQTFEKLHENWRNLETFLRNLQVRRSQEESQRGASSSPSSPRSNSNGRFNPASGVDGSGSRDVYTLRYHPILEGHGPTNVNEFGRQRNHNGIGASFNPYPYDPKGDGNKDIDMERHTIATIYTIGICLSIMAIGSVMFILINKCDGRNDGAARQGSIGQVRSRITRSMIGAMGRPAAAGRQGRTRRAAGGGGGGRSNTSGSNNNNNNHTSSGGGAAGGDLSEMEVKILTDLPPSYESLFPDGGPPPDVKVTIPPEPSTSITRTAPETNNVNLDLNNHNNSSSENSVSYSQNQNANANPASGTNVV